MIGSNNQKTEEIWKAFSHRLKAFISHRISDQDIVDDILQDIFIKIHANIDSLKDESKMKSWVFQITRNAINDYYRKQKMIHESLDQIEIPDEPEEEMTADQEIAMGLRFMIYLLPDKYAEALSYVEFEGMSQVELAEKLGISVSGAKSRVQRGRAMLRDMLLQCCQFDFDQRGTIIDYRPNECLGCGDSCMD